MRNFVFLKNQRKKIFILDQSSYIPDFMGYFRSKKEPYHRLNITNYSNRADPITNYYQYENKFLIKEGYVEGKFAQEEEEEEEIFDKYDYNLSKRPESLEDYGVLIVMDHIYNWASLELKKSLKETVEKTEYVSEQRFQLLELPVFNILTMDQDTYKLLKSLLLSLRSFEADYIACNEQLYVTDLFLDEN